MPEPLESGDQVLIEDRYLTVQNQRGFGQCGNRRGELAEASCVIAAIPTE